MHRGEQIHRQLASDADSESILLETDVAVNLLNLYGKCGMVKSAESVFKHVRSGRPSVFYDEIRIWNAMINAYGRNGRLKEAVDLFDSV